MKKYIPQAVLLVALLTALSAPAATRPNVLFIISDDLTYTALSCYGNTVSRTPNIDRLAAQGTRFTRALCQGTYCGPSRASFMSGYYPHATGVLGYTNPRPQIGDRATWSQHFKNAGYYAARVSKIYHMGVPGGIEEGGDGRDHDNGNGADDALSWTERFNSPGPEWKAPGTGETLEGNPDGKRPVVGGNTFVVVEADGDDLVHSDGKTAAKAVELIQKHAGKPFFLAVGFVRPHVPFVAPRKYYEPYLPYDKMVLPPKIAGDWDDIPKPGINYKTSVNMKMDERRQRKAVGGYYASVAFMDAQVGKVLDALDKSGQADKIDDQFKKLAEAYPKKWADLTFEWAMLNEMQGKKEQSEKLLTQVIEKEPKHPKANNALGYSWADKGKNLAKAEQMIKLALDDDPDSAAYLDSMGWVKYKQGQFDDAVKWLERARLEEGGDHAVILDHLADALYRAGRQVEALQWWMKAQSTINPKEVDDDRSSRRSPRRCG
ncbi:MAG: sulfatase-like hydrolase/transferase [Rhodobacteraceae bacterium]|nr:sulfatase-like hydrolase/transferase [Paracoccaceae bacterium]